MYCLLYLISNFLAKNNGTEFSVANSAYAGMILGYTRIANDDTSSGNEVINLTGLSATASVADVTTQAAAIVSLSGISVSASPGFILVYGLIDTDQTASYSEVSTTQTPSYSEVATTQSPNYTTIDAGRDAA